MAAIEIPWLDSMSPSPYPQNDGSSGQPNAGEVVPPTVAAFSPANIAGSSLTSKQRSTIIVHRKSPLLAATPPAVTRALAYSHPFLLPLNRLAGLLSWTSGDPWESFLLVAAFWAVTLYGSAIILWGGPLLVVVVLILGMYSRRYSPLSSTGLTGEKHFHSGDNAECSSRPHKTLDEIVETLRIFTMRCKTLLEPLRDLTDFLSTQQTATSATTRPALTALLMRIILVTPVWILLTLPPFYLITLRRVVITVGTIILTWHSKPARIFRVVLWRSLAIRRICSMITGLQFSSVPLPTEESDTKLGFKSSLLSLRPFRSKSLDNHGTDIGTHKTKKRRAGSSGVRFTFILYENQRRWLGIGWTYSLFAYERAAWTDEHLNPAPTKDEFELPDVQGVNARWRWVSGSQWHVDCVTPTSNSKKFNKNGRNNDEKDGGDGGWIYYDNKWNDPRRGQDGWGRYTRRRKWCRDAELVEVSPSTEITPPPTPPFEKITSISATSEVKPKDENGKPGSEGHNSLKQRKRRWFGSNGDVKTVSSSFPDSSSSSLPGPSLSTSGSAEPKPSVKPPSISSARSVPFEYGRSASFDGAAEHSRNGAGKRRDSKATSTNTNTDKESLTLSIREQENEKLEDTVDKWGGRPGGTVERSGRAWGLGDDAFMGLS